MNTPLHRAHRIAGCRTSNDFAALSDGELLDLFKRLLPKEYADEPISFGFNVEGGWIRYRRCGGYVYGDYTESVWEDFSDVTSAKACYLEAVDGLKSIYRTERMTAGRCWREQDVYVRLSAYVLDDEGERIYEHVLQEDRYGTDGYEVS